LLVNSDGWLASSKSASSRKASLQYIVQLLPWHTSCARRRKLARKGWNEFGRFDLRSGMDGANLNLDIVILEEVHQWLIKTLHSKLPKTRAPSNAHEVPDYGAKFGVVRHMEESIQTAIFYETNDSSP